MPDIFMDVDVALAEVPVNILPLLDDSDFKSREVAVAYDAAGMDLVWNFVTTGGAMTQTAVTPTTSGNYDWAHQGDGMYSIEIPASGGASINNDTEGFGWFTGIATGVLPWRGPVIGFRAAALNNALIDGGDTLDVNVTEWLGTAAATPTVAGVPEVDMTHLGGVAQSATDLKDFADDGYDPATNKVQGVVLTDTLTTYTGNTVQTGDSFARLGAPAGASIAADIAAVEAQTDDIGVAGAGLTALATQASVNTIDDFLDTEIAAIVTATTAAAIRAAVGLGSANLDTQLDAIPTAAEINAQVLDVLNVDTFAEPGQEAPGATVTLVQKIGYLYKAFRNKKTQTATTMSLFADDASTVDQKATISDDSTTYTHGELTTGP